MNKNQFKNFIFSLVIITASISLAMYINLLVSIETMYLGDTVSEYQIREILDNKWSFTTLFTINPYTNEIITNTNSTIYIFNAIILSLSILVIVLNLFYTYEFIYKTKKNKIYLLSFIPMFMMFLSSTLTIANINSLTMMDIALYFEGVKTSNISFFVGTNSIPLILLNGSTITNYFPFFTSSDNFEFTSLPTNSGPFIMYIISILANIGNIILLSLLKKKEIYQEPPKVLVFNNLQNQDPVNDLNK